MMIFVFDALPPLRSISMMVPHNNTMWSNATFHSCCAMVVSSDVEVRYVLRRRGRRKMAADIVLGGVRLISNGTKWRIESQYIVSIRICRFFVSILYCLVESV